MATVSFSKETYSVDENDQKLILSILRSGDIESSVVVLIANHPYAGTASGKFFPLLLFPNYLSLYNPSLFTPLYAYVLIVTLLTSIL